MARFFIDRPIFAIVLSIFIVLAGTISAFNLPVAQYPQIQPPTVSVSARYVGANADVVNKTVAQVIEEQVNGVQGMDYMSSTSDNSGYYSLNMVFDLGIDGDNASVKVQNNISQANASLPNEVKEVGVVTQKASSDMALVMSLYSPKGTHDDVFIYNYAKVYLLDDIRRVNGVGEVGIFGSELARRIWINPDRMAELDITITEVTAALKEQNIQAPAGTVGGLPSSDLQEFQYAGMVEGRLESIEDFENIIIRAKGSSITYLRDIARVENSSRSISTIAKLDGREAVGIAIQLTDDANALDTINKVKNVMQEAEKNLPPDVEYSIVVDTSENISASMREVIKTFFEALALVTIIVYLFLQSWRATIIPMLAVPVSIIGTFTSFLLLGFTINTLTLFAMVLSVGLVIDDAIVVIEAVEHHMRTERLSAREATSIAMAEISGPVVAIAFVLVAVFIPVSFFGGMTGILYKQFAITITVSIAISAFVALSLTPALCATLLKPYEEHSDKTFTGRFFRKFNDWMERSTESYSNTVRKCIHHAKHVIITLAVLVVGTVYLYHVVPETFVPAEDQGYLIAIVNLPEGASLKRTQRVMDKLSSDMREIGGVREVMTIAGFDMTSYGRKPSAGALFVKLTDWGERTDSGTQVNPILGQMMQKSSVYPEATAFAMNPPALPGLGMLGGFTMVLQDVSGYSNEDLDRIAKAFTFAANTQVPEVTGVYTTYKNDSPNIRFRVDREKTKLLGVALNDVFTALQVNYGGFEVNDFNMFGRTYKVVMQAEQQFRGEAENIRFMYVRSASGQMVPLDALLTPETITAPATITRFNAARSIQINGNVASGYSSGQAISAMEKLAASQLPDGFKVEWSDQSREEKKSSSSTLSILALAMIFVFLCLAALYESWAIPYAVILSVPTGIFGAFFSQHIMGLENSIYVQIGVITLIGLAARNAILIVEYAKIRADNGMEPVQAAVEAAGLRLRPILMTVLTFVIGCLPLVFATGAGAGARNAMGTAVVGGMAIATGLGLFLIPVLFVVIEWAIAKMGKHENAQEQTND